MFRQVSGCVLMLSAATLIASAQAPATTPPAGQAVAPGGPQPGRGGGRGVVVSPQVNPDKDDTLVGASAKSLDALLTTKGIKHSFVLGEGRHEWVVWQHHLIEVAPLLFR